MKIVSKGHFSRNRFHMARKRYPRWVMCSTRIFYLPLLFGRMMLPHTDFDKYIFEESQLFTLLWLFLLIFEVFFKFFVSSSIWIHMLTGSMKMGCRTEICYPSPTCSYLGEQCLHLLVWQENFIFQRPQQQAFHPKH